MLIRTAISNYFYSVREIWKLKICQVIREITCSFWQFSWKRRNIQSKNFPLILLLQKKTFETESIEVLRYVICNFCKIKGVVKPRHFGMVTVEWIPNQFAVKKLNLCILVSNCTWVLLRGGVKDTRENARWNRTFNIAVNDHFDAKKSAAFNQVLAIISA